MEYTPSEEQQKIYKFVRTGIGSAFIEAYAGCGKSTTLLGCLEQIKPDKSVLMIAHNVDIVNHLKDKIRSNGIRDIDGGAKKLTNICTYHALGYRIILENLEKLGLKDKPKTNERKYVKYINEHFDELCDGALDGATKTQIAIYKSNIMFLIGFCRHNINQSVSDVKKTIEHFKMNIVSNEAEAVLKCMQWGKTHLDEIDFQDMIWLPYELRLQTKIFLSDFVFVDEAQDTSMAQFELFKKCIKRNTRYVAVGDQYQTINMWCGSDKNSFKKFGSIGHRVTKFTLTQTYRCGKKIIELANKIVPGIVANENNVVGAVNYNVSKSEIRPGDMVLCRNTAPLMQLYLELIKAGKKAYIQGEPHTYNSLLYFAMSLNATDVAEMVYNSQKMLIDEWEKIASMYNETLEDSACNERIVNLYDQVKTIMSIAGYCRTIDDVYETIINAQFNEEHKDDDAIKLSTIHRAKGLEKDRVFILHPSLIPSKFAKTEWEIESEVNLEYVMITRAISSLNYLSEDDSLDKALISPLSMYTKLKSIKNNLHLN